ncbi:MAG: acyltransferase [Clostridia bacterium]|nr:acyltransferase [Clostridia bacterium]
MKGSNRIQFLDMLRAFIIFLVIVLHTAISYIKPQIYGWVHNPEENNALFGIICTVLDSPILMAVMFFIAGYFTLPSIRQKGVKQFLTDRCIRLGIPQVLGLVFLVPGLSYTAYLSSGQRMNYFDFWVSKGFKPEFFNHAHLWFLGILLYFSFITAFIFSILKVRGKAFRERNKKPSWRLFVLFIAVTTGMHFIVYLRYSTFAWTSTYFIAFQNVGMPLYICYFLFGMYAHQRNWFRADGYKPGITPWAVFYTFSILVYTVLYAIVFHTSPGTPVEKLAVALMLNISILSWTLLLLGVFQRVFHGDHPIVRKISSVSYGTYIVHLNIAFAVLYATRNVHLPVVLKFLVQILTGMILSWSVGYMLKQMPALKKVL